MYISLINKSQSQQRIRCSEIYYELHHILPKCLGGDDYSENLVLLTAREHFIAHKLLTKIYPDNKKLIFALWCFLLSWGVNFITPA